MYGLNLPLRLILFVSLLAVSSSICAQNSLVEIDKPTKAQNLAGRVQLGKSPEGVKGVLVEDCSRDRKTVKFSTHTDKDGRFRFPDASARGIHYLRLSFNGANTLLIKVKLDPSGQAELSLVLSFST